MKQILLLPLLACLFIFTQCKKDKNSPEPDNPYGLPNATQEGKNTLGFLLNGVAWTPQGFNGTANLSIDFDEGVNNGIFTISAYTIASSGDRSYFGVGIKDSVNTIVTPTTYSLESSSLYGVYFSNDNCTFDYFDNLINRTGTLTITKLDRSRHIISGIFNATLSKNGCNIINVTQGRFDMSY